MKRPGPFAIGRSLDVLNHRSLDAPGVAVIWALVIAQDSGLEPVWLQIVIVGASVWLVYAGDRWMDGRHAPKNRTTPLPPRHAFARVHARQIAIVWIAVCLSSAGLALRFGERGFLARGLCLLAAAGLYFFLVHRSAAIRRLAARAGFKEVSTAMFLWLAVSAVAQSTPVPGTPVAAAALGLFWLNALAVSRAEANPADSAWKHPRVGRISVSIAGAITVSAMAGGLTATASAPLLHVSLIVSTLSLLLAASIPGALRRYPSLADLAIALPLLLPLAFPHT